VVLSFILTQSYLPSTHVLPVPGHAPARRGRRASALRARGPCSGEPAAAPLHPHAAGAGASGMVGAAAAALVPQLPGNADDGQPCDAAHGDPNCDAHASAWRPCGRVACKQARTLAPPGCALHARNPLEKAPERLPARRSRSEQRHAFP